MIQEAGKYVARAVSAEFGYTATGTEQIAVLFETEAGDSITWYGYFTEKATSMTLKALRAAGWDGQDLAELAGLGAVPVSLDVQWDEYQGQRRLRVAWVNALNAPALKNTMSAADKAAFAARMKGQVLAHLRAEGPAAVAAPAPVAPRGAQEDRIPF